MIKKVNELNRCVYSSVKSSWIERIQKNKFMYIYMSYKVHQSTDYSHWHVSPFNKHWREKVISSILTSCILEYSLKERDKHFTNN